MSIEAMHASLRENLRLMMQSKGLSQRGLSRLAALDETAVKQILSGRSRSPRLETVARLASALDTSVAQLTGEQATDVEFYTGLLDVLEILRAHGLLAMEEHEARTLAAAIAEGLANDGVGVDTAAMPKEHVGAVVRNLVSIRKFNGSEPQVGRRSDSRQSADGSDGDPQRVSSRPTASSESGASVDTDATEHDSRTSGNGRSGNRKSDEAGPREWEKTN